ncbi:MAG: GGDEF domain-containing protein [Leptolyngbya sp. SIO3F4]|nr:GGDEF domain-containing protein [Leptolyngbya sp. SIO3F4]
MSFHLQEKKLESDGPGRISNKALNRQELVDQDLSKFHVLRHMDINSVWGILSACEIRELAPEEKLISLGAFNQCMYILLSGRCGVYLETTSDVMFYLEPGQSAGEMSLMDGNPASAHVVATTATRVLVVEEMDFWRLIRASHEFSTNLLLLLSTRLRVNNTSLCESAEKQRRFESEAMTDGLTGLFNRRWLDQKLWRLMERYVRSKRPLCLLMIDVDHFKKFNDTHGHLAGDIALCAVGRALIKYLRPLDVAIRYGGEEFTVILPETDIEGAKSAAERLRVALSEMDIVGPNDKQLPRVTVSMGISTMTVDDTPPTLIKRADSALYAAKGNGRNRIEVAE